MAANQDYAKTLTSFSGSDLVVNFGPKTIGELQQISWGIKREKAPVFTLGSPDPRSFSRGKRGIGGSLIFAQFNRDALMQELVEDSNVWNKIAPVAMFTAAGNLSQRNTENFAYAIHAAGWNKTINDALATGASADGVNQTPGLGTNYQYYGVNTNGRSDAITPGSTYGSRTGTKEMVNVPPGFGVIRANNIVYADMIPPFDVTLTFANEYGQTAFQKIYDIDILDESSGVSVDSIVMERAMSYVARRISPLMEGIYNREKGGVLTPAAVYTPPSGGTEE